MTGAGEPRTGAPLAGAGAGPPTAEPAGAILILSATDFETAGLRAGLRAEANYDTTRQPEWPWPIHGTMSGVPVMLAASGVGKANAAAAVASLAGCSGRRPLVGIIQVGIGGAYRGSGLALGNALLANSEFDLDLGVGRRPTWTGLESIGLGAFTGHHGELNRIAFDSDLTAKLREACGLSSAPFATSDSVTADTIAAADIAKRHGVAVESMEGVAAAQVAAAFSLPFAEIRGISNFVGERDKHNWRVAEAVAATVAAAGPAVTVMWEHTARSS